LSHTVLENANLPVSKLNLLLHSLNRVLTAPGTLGNTGNLLELNWRSWKIAHAVQCPFNKLAEWHSDEHWSELIITCSFTDVLGPYTFDVVW